MRSLRLSCRNKDDKSSRAHWNRFDEGRFKMEVHGAIVALQVETAGARIGFPSA